MLFATVILSVAISDVLILLFSISVALPSGPIVVLPVISTVSLSIVVPDISAPSAVTVNLLLKVPVPATFRLPSVAVSELFSICMAPFIVVVPVILVGLLITTWLFSAFKTEVVAVLSFTSKVLFIVTDVLAIIPSEFAISWPFATFKLGVLMLVVADRVSVVNSWLICFPVPALFSILFAIIGSLALASSFKA